MDEGELQKLSPTTSFGIRPVLCSPSRKSLLLCIAQEEVLRAAELDLKVKLEKLRGIREAQPTSEMFTQAGKNPMVPPRCSIAWGS